jgi:Ca2+-binding EF-hand superfamily protein
MAEEQKTIDYEVTAEQRKHLSPQEISGFIKAFNNYDLNKDGTMDQKEFKNIMIDLGERKTDDAAAQAMLDANDSN